MCDVIGGEFVEDDGDEDRQRAFVTGSTPDGPPPCLRLAPSSVSFYKWFCSRQTVPNHAQNC
eukprot:912600-Amphidinium_carterae.2